jgi:hypothetical protein
MGEIMISFPYEINLIIRSLSEAREVDENNVFGDLTSIYCLGKRNKELFFRLVWREYGNELAKYKRSFSVADVEHESYEGQNITILRVKP